MSTNDDLIVVSGIPRSGTSMLMQMLRAGGIELCTDAIRQADHQNPRGYFEVEAVKRTRHDSSWLTLAPGRAVKVIYRFVYDLPKDRSYKLLFALRRLSEVVASQARMLPVAGSWADEPRSDEVLLWASELARFREWARWQKHLKILYVPYSRVIRSPLSEARHIAAFLERDLCVAAMADAVDPTLYRNR